MARFSTNKRFHCWNQHSLSSLEKGQDKLLAKEQITLKYYFLVLNNMFCWYILPFPWFLAWRIHLFVGAPIRAYKWTEINLENYLPSKAMPSMKSLHGWSLEKDSSSLTRYDSTTKDFQSLVAKTKNSKDTVLNEKCLWTRKIVHKLQSAEKEQARLLHYAV